MDNNFFSIYKNSDWIEGKFENLSVQDGKIKIITSERYVTNRQISSDEIVVKQVDNIRFNSKEKLYCGTYFSKIFDAINPETIWDKVYVDAELPKDCMYSVAYYAFNDYDLNISDEKTTFSQYITSDNTVNDKEKFMHTKWQGDILNFNKAIFTNAVGRYMILKIKLWGNNTNTPKIRKIRVYYNRDTYTKYLPEIYSQGTDSFLERYLSLAETFMMDMEEKIDNISDNFDPDKAPKEMLKWLCGWLDIEVDTTWSDEKIRLLLKKAPDIFKRRGTKSAISEILEIYLGVKPVIVEDFKLNEMRSIEGMKDIVNRLYKENPYGYTVIVKMDRDLDFEEKMAIKKILDNESPAYCTYRFIVLEDWMALDKHTYLGINSRIMDWSRLKLDGKSVLPYNAILFDKM